MAGDLRGRERAAQVGCEVTFATVAYRLGLVALGAVIMHCIVHDHKLFGLLAIAVLTAATWHSVVGKFFEEP